MSNEKYPLWCVDRGEGGEDERYLGPFATEGEARSVGAWARIRRCRRVKTSEMEWGELDVDNIVDSVAEDTSPPQDDAWADWMP